MKKRPLSPHLQIYRWQWTMLGSILHRMSGVVLSFSLILITVSLWLLAFSPDGYTILLYVGGSIFGNICLFFMSLAFSYHICNGIRHLLWDMGKNLELFDAKRSAHYVFISTFILTLLFWLIACNVV